MSEAGREFISALEDVMMRLHMERRRFSKGIHLTPLQFIILTKISLLGGLTMSQIASTLGVKPQTVTHMVDALERNGWVRRSRSPRDRRVIVLEITPAGTRLVGRAKDTFRRRLEKALEPASQEALHSVAVTLRNALLPEAMSSTRARKRTRGPT